MAEEIESHSRAMPTSSNNAFLDKSVSNPPQNWSPARSGVET